MLEEYLRHYVTTSQKNWLELLEPAQLITTQIVLFYTLTNKGFEHFLRSNKPN